MGARFVDPTSQTLLLMGVPSVAIVHSGDMAARDLGGHNQVMSTEVSSVGDLLGTGVPGALIALGQYTFDSENADAHARALISTGLTVLALKIAVGRQRPTVNGNHWSFPSGHTSTTFATATALTYAYGWKVGAIACPLAFLTGVSRVADDAHWLSDTVAGAFIGITMARAAYLGDGGNKQGSSKLSAWNWGPMVDGEATGLLVHYQF